jgi:hypothetical protein
MTRKDDKLVFDISARIVRTIIGDLFFCDDDVLANTVNDDDNDDDVANAITKKAAKKAKEKTNALKLFVKNENDPDWYHVVIPNAMQFELAMATSRSVCHSGKQRLPSSMPGTILRGPR